MDGWMAAERETKIFFVTSSGLLSNFSNIDFVGNVARGEGRLSRIKEQPLRPQIRPSGEGRESFETKEAWRMDGWMNRIIFDRVQGTVE